MTKDPKLCQLPHCPLQANGHDWILMQREDGTWAREGYCSQYHAHLASEFYDTYGFQHKLVLESDPRDNYEDRVRMRREGGGG